MYFVVAVNCAFPNVINPLFEIKIVFSLIPLKANADGNVIAPETISVFKDTPDWKTVPVVSGL